MNTEQTDATLALLVSQGFSPTIFTRFWAKVQKSQEPNGCWLWTGTTSGYAGLRYGRIHASGKSRTAWAHRLSWIIHNGTIPDDLRVLHNCPGGDNPLCVNPEHLFLGTQMDNLRDCAKKDRTHRGYKLTDEDVSKIIRCRNTMNGKDIAARFGVSQVLISQILHGLRYQRIWRNLAETPLTTDGRKRIVTNS